MRRYQLRRADSTRNFGITFLNVRHENQQRVDNPFFGTVANTPPEVVIMSFRDDSPEDGRIGAAFKQMEVVVRYQERKFERIDITEDPATNPTQPARRVSSSLSRPTANPTRVAVALPTPRAMVKVTEAS